MEANKRIGDYEILDELGSGGMGRVFRVRNTISDRIEAMKILLPDLAGRQDLAARFLREIKVLAALNHPNVAALRTALSADNQLVMIMEYVEGQSVADRLAHGPIPTADALKYIDQVLDALSYAHAQHVIHRDIKPANMMLTTKGVVKLTDFGIARSANDQSLTVTGTTTGSLSYMSPEQVNGDPTDPRSDLYSVGVSLYEMVTGVRPFQADSDFAVMLAHVNEAPRPPIDLQPALAPALNDIILKAIAKNPADRFQSADDFRRALRSLPAAGLSQTASRNATVLASTVTGAGPAQPDRHTSTTRLATDHPRTLLDTRTPSSSRTAVPRVGGPAMAAASAPAGRTTHPGVYMALGGVLVIIALIGTGIYLRKAEAGTASPSKSASTPATSVTPAPVAPAPTTASAPPPAPAPSPVPAPPTSSSSATAPSAQPTAMTGTVARPARVKSTPPSPGGAEVTEKRATDADAKGNAKAPAHAGDSETLDQLEQAIDGLSARAGAVNNSLDRLQQEQARQGLGLRGDMAARQQSMNLNLTKAERAVEQHDAARARKYRDLAQSDIEALEQFLGR